MGALGRHGAVVAQRAVGQADDGPEADLAGGEVDREVLAVVGRAVVLTGRLSDLGDTALGLRISGTAHSQRVESTIRVELLDETATDAALPAVWARMKIADLADRSLLRDDVDLPARIKQVALEHGLMSAYTAFVAVDSSYRTKGAHGTTVPVAVPVPDGVQYSTTVAPE